jgi:hypothetical protein
VRLDPLSWLGWHAEQDALSFGHFVEDVGP